MSISKKAPAGAKVFNLEATRNARAEARAGEAAPFIKLSAGFVEIKPEFDVLVAEDLMNGNLRHALTRLLVDPDDVKALLKEGITDSDLQELIEFASGKKLGE